MKSSIIVYKALSEVQSARLQRQFNVIQLPELNPSVLADYAADIASVVGLLGSGGQVDAAMLAQMPALQAVSAISVGYDNFDVAALSARGVALLHTPTVLTETVADSAMLLMLMSARRGLELAERVKAGEWQHSVDEAWYGSDVHHKTLGIIGMGRIGQALAQRAYAGFAMPVLYHSRRRHQEVETRFNARYCDLPALLAEADFVCSILPLTPETRGLLKAAEFARMKSSAIFINIGRGQVVDETALIAALENGVIRAAGLDVFEYEPLAVDSPLLTLRNVVALPHIGSATHETRYNMEVCAVDNLIRALNGDVTQNCVNAHQLINVTGRTEK